MNIAASKTLNIWQILNILVSTNIKGFIIEVIMRESVHVFDTFSFLFLNCFLFQTICDWEKVTLKFIMQHTVH